MQGPQGGLGRLKSDECIEDGGFHPFQNSNSEHLEALKRSQGRWIVAWPPHPALLSFHNHLAGPIDRDLGGSETLTGPMDRDFLLLGLYFELLGASWELFWFF